MDSSQGIESKYRFILLAAKRARQLQAGARPLIQTATTRPTRVAQLEVASNLVPFENLKVDTNSGSKEPGES